MLVVDFDPTRDKNSGQFHVRLIDAASGDYGYDAKRQSQTGYWCDLGHLENGIVRPAVGALRRKQHPNPKEVIAQRLVSSASPEDKANDAFMTFPRAMAAAVIQALTAQGYLIV